MWGWPNSRTGHIFTHRRRCVMPLDTAKLDFYVLLFLFFLRLSLAWPHQPMLIYAALLQPLISSLFFFRFVFLLLAFFFYISLSPVSLFQCRTDTVLLAFDFHCVFHACVCFFVFFFYMLKWLFPSNTRHSAYLAIFETAGTVWQ